MIIKNYNQLANSNSRRKALQIIDAGLESINTDKIMDSKVRLKGDSLVISNYKDSIKKINLEKYKRIVVIGFGKSSSLMAKHVEKVLGNRIDDGIVISTKKLNLKRIKVIKGTHPYVSQTNVNAAKKIVELVKKLNKDDLIISLVSGGGSALLCYPNMPFKKYTKEISKHFASGIDIVALNKIRKKLSRVKGGKLAKLTKAKIVSLIFSDVVGDDLYTIASGPTVGKDLKNVDNILLLNNTVALDAMKEKAQSLGLKPVIVTNKLKGEARFSFKKIIKKNKIKNKKNIALFFAGETTVTVKGTGKGGRNQELCLGALEDISKLKNIVLVSVGSDGMDGPTDAAGSIVDEKSLQKSINKRLDYKEYLKNNASYPFFKKTKELIFTGLTGSNVADIGLILKL
ncbi:glycerate kinase [Nanoarchaeota archaeon]